MAPLLRSWAPLLAVRFLPARTTGIQVVSLPETRKTWRQPETADFQELSIQPVLLGKEHVALQKRRSKSGRLKVGN